MWPENQSKVKYNQYSFNFNFISGWIEKMILYYGTGTLEDVYLLWLTQAAEFLYYIHVDIWMYSVYILYNSQQ